MSLHSPFLSVSLLSSLGENRTFGPLLAENIRAHMLSPFPASGGIGDDKESTTLSIALGAYVRKLRGNARRSTALFRLPDLEIQLAKAPKRRQRLSRIGDVQ